MAKLFDPIHGFIRFDEDEMRFIDSDPIFRLRSIKQLGMAYLLYPGATHSRFEHSLGVMEMASRIYDRLCSLENTILPKLKTAEYEKWRKKLRLAAIFHDVGHLPFSHSAEKMIPWQGHEEMGGAIMEEMGLCDIAPIAFTHYPKNNPIETILCQIITGDFFGADRIDYLLRDAHATGVCYGRLDVDYLLEQLIVCQEKIGINEDGLDAVTSLVLARHFMHRRIYRHPRIQSIHWMIAHIVCDYFIKYNVLSEPKRFLKVNDAHIFMHLEAILHDAQHPLYSYAKALRFMDERFFVARIPSFFRKEIFEKEWKKIEIPPNEGVFEEGKQTCSPLCFPVRLRSGKITEAQRVMTMHPPSYKEGWVAVHPKWKEQMIEILAKSE